MKVAFSFDMFLIFIGVLNAMDIEVRNREIIIKPIKPARGKYRLGSLLSNETTQSKEYEWGAPSGKELW
jgi:hypothetical protein